MPCRSPVAFVSRGSLCRPCRTSTGPLSIKRLLKTEAKQWSAIPPRLEENYARMRANNVVISSDLDPELQATLRDAAQDTIRAWLSKAGPAGQTILTEFRETPPRP